MASATNNAGINADLIARGHDTEAADTGGAPRPGIAVIAGMYPAASETFVYREVGALRQRGWTVQTVSLHTAQGRAADITGRDEPETMTVYGSAKARTGRAALAELATHPWRTLATIATAIKDALSPGEPTSLPARLKIIGQAIFAVGLARRLRKCEPAHLHCHFAHAPTTLGMYAARQLDLPFSFTGHANDIFQRRILLARKLARAAFVSCISEWHRAFYRDIHARDDEAYPVVRCGVAVDEWRPEPVCDTEQATRIITVARLVEKKGIDTLIRAFAQLDSAAPSQWSLTIVGDGPMREQLTTLARELQCEQGITWLGAVNNRRVRELLTQADIFALPCRTDRQQDRDGIPVVLMEAMACGLPTVAGDLTAIRELVKHERTGLLTPGGDHKAVASALTRLHDDPALRQKLGQAGQARVHEEFAQTVNIDRLTRAIECAALRTDNGPRKAMT